MKLRLAVLAAVLAVAFVAIPASAAEAAYPSCAIAWGALNGGSGSDNDMVSYYGGKPVYYADCTHAGTTWQTWVVVEVWYGPYICYHDMWFSYYANHSSGTIYDRFDHAINQCGA